MAQPQYAALPAISATDEATPKVAERWLVLARVVWVVIALACLVSLTVGLIQTYSNIIQFSERYFLPPEVLRAGLANLGIPSSAYALFHFIRILLLEAGFVVTGILIFYRKPNEWGALYFSLLLIVFGALFSLPVSQNVVDSSPTLAFVVNFAFESFFFSFYLFPDGQFVPRWTRWLLIYWILTALGLSFFAGTALDTRTWPPPADAIVIISSLGSCVAAQIYRYVRVATPIQRQQTKWIIFAFTAMIIIWLAFWGLLDHIPALKQSSRLALFYDSIGGSLLVGAFVCVPLSLGFAILKYRLWDIDPLINRALVYAILTVLVVGLYVLIVGVLGALLRTSDNILVSLVATGVIAVLFQPLRQSIQRLINRLMYGERDDPYAVMVRLGQRLEATLPPDAVLPTIVETVREALRLPYAAVTLTTEDTPRDKQPAMDQIIAASGSPLGETTVVPLVYRGAPVGQLILGNRARWEAFTPADYRFLTDFSRQASVAVHAIRLTIDLQHLSSDLQGARERLVMTREEERRRLRRDLHDDVGPVLASLYQRLDAARSLIRDDPEVAIELVSDVQAQVKATIADIRRLVYALRPPALDELGLLSALREQIATYQSHGRLSVRLEAPARLPALPAAVEVAIYRITLEALTNVIRYAEARTCCIRIAVNVGDSTGLVLEITDDGIGLPNNYHAGVGIMSMRERAEELGGSFELTSTVGNGTVVRARLPIGTTVMLNRTLSEERDVGDNL